jgi:hypothetical protein
VSGQCQAILTVDLIVQSVYSVKQSRHTSLAHRRRRLSSSMPLLRHPRRCPRPRPPHGDASAHPSRPSRPPAASAVRARPARLRPSHSSTAVSSTARRRQRVVQTLLPPSPHHVPPRLRQPLHLRRQGRRRPLRPSSLRAPPPPPRPRNRPPAASAAAAAPAYRPPRPPHAPDSPPLPLSYRISNTANILCAISIYLSIYLSICHPY